MIVKESSSFQDVVIVGAGVSGINFGYRLQEQNPELSYTILEGRDAIGGTWDLFKFPGIRSDSDLYTFGFPWRPWEEQSSITKGPLIAKYVRESAAMYGIDKKIQFRHNLTAASWSSEQQTWNLSVDADGISKSLTCRFLLMCTGYYDYKSPLETTVPGLSNFKGPVIHPQFWPQDLDYSNKKIAIIGSGATAVTLLPSLAEKASLVTMLQRSPSFVVSQPAEDDIEKFIRRWFPVWMARKMIRFKWLILPFMIINFAKYFPKQAREMFIGATRKQLPESIKADLHFNPRYNPFEQRVCFCPDGDFYGALRSGKADIVTDTIETVTDKSIKLKSGQELNPDIIVTATGLRVSIMAGVSFFVDGKSIKASDSFVWKSCMIQNLPNIVLVFGYVDASWTLGADSTALLVCRLLRKMQKDGYKVAVPRMSEKERNTIKEVPLLKLTSTYITKAKDIMPKAGDQVQWRARSSYFRDWYESRYGDLVSGMEYQR